MPVLQPIVRKVLVVTAGVTLLASCTSANGNDGPTAAEAGTQLAQDARALLDKVQDLHNLPQPYTVTDDASKDQSCGKDKAKRIFVAKTRIPVGADLDDRLDGETSVAMGTLPPRYEIEQEPGSDDLSGRRLVLRDAENRLRLTVQLTPAGSEEVDYVVSGETDCLGTA